MCIRKVIVNGEIVLTGVCSADNKIELMSMVLGEVFFPRIDKLRRTKLHMSVRCRR